MHKHLLRACLALFALLILGWHTEAQILYTEGFENESPYDAADLCSPANEYTPSDGSWSLGPACALPDNGFAQLVDYDGDIHLQWNNEYGADSEVFNSATMDISGLSQVRISFDARSMGDLEDGGAYLDEFDVYVVMDGTETNIFSRNAHVDGTKKGGDNAVRTYSYSEQFAATGDEMFMRIKVKISGSGQEEQYAVAGLSVCVDANDNGTCDCEEPMTWSEDLSDYTVECLGDLPTECDASVTASRGTVSCGYAESEEGRTNCEATTPDGMGDDFAFVLYDIDGDDDDDRFFVPTTEGLTLTQYDNGVAIVAGQVEDVDDPTAILNLYVYYDDAVSGADWPTVSGLDPAFAFKHEEDCPVTSDITDDWTIYMLNSGLSFATGEGSLNGTTLQLGHVSAFGFQVGQMANTRNCNYGAGGWLNYSGFLNGSPIQGGTGDLLVDLECSEQINNTCGDGESTVTLVYTAYDDACGEVLQAVQVVDREDTTDPTFDNAPDNVTVDCSVGLPAVPTVTGSDNCQGSDPTAPVVTYSGQTPPYNNSCTGSYQVDRTWTVEDCSGNQAAHTQTITVVDNTAPVITAGSSYTAECDGSGNTAELNGWLNNNGNSSAIDACSDVTWTNDFTGLSDDCGETGSATVTFSAADECGNTSTVTLTFLIEDTVDPSITTDASDQTVECDGSGNTTAVNAWLANNGGAVATDLCSNVTWTNNYTGLSDECGATGSATVTFTATDDCGNASTTTATFTIEDTTNPSIGTQASDQTVECDASGNTAALTAWLDSNGGAAATDACSAVTWTNNYAGLSDDCGLTGSATVTFTATDDCGNASTTMATFTIEDTTSPYLSGGADQTVECDGAGNVSAFNSWIDGYSGATATDDCSAVTWSQSPDPAELSDECGATGSVTVTFTASDACGNTSTVTSTFTIEDTTAPSLTSTASDETVDCDGSGNTTELTNWLNNNGGAAATDVCSAVTWSYSPDPATISDACGETGSVTVTFTASDDCNNTTTTTATFTIEDNTAPSITTQASNQTVECDGSGNTTALNSWLTSNGGAAATDACSAVTWTNNFTTLSDDCGATGSATVTFTATDACGNASTTTATFTIEDTTAPTWDDYSVYVYAACEDILDPTDPTLVPITASDDCGNVTYSIEAYQLSGGCPGTWMRVWTATDECENVSVTTEQYVQLYDNIKPVPVITCPADYTVDADENCQADLTPAAAGSATATATDNCAADEDITIVITSVDGLTTPICDGAYFFTRTWTATATDECDNTDAISCDQLITVEDNTAPIISGGADLTVECDGAGNADDLAGWLANNGGATATDNCSDITWTYAPNPAELSDLCAATGAVTVVFTATDDCGNASSTSALTFTIEDTTAPTIAGDLGVTIDCDEWSCDADALEALELFTVTEDCGNYTLAIECAPYSGGCVQPIPAYEVTITATDECGNPSAEFVQIINLVDEDAPTIDTEASDETVECDGSGNLTALNAWLDSHGGALASDACSDVHWSNDFTALSDDCGATGSVTVTFTATDDCNNTSNTTATFTIEDTTDPTIDAAAADETVECDGSGNTTALSAWLSNNGGATATDACSDVTWSYSPDPATISDECGETGSVTVTFTASDACSNTSTTTATFTIEDTTDPSIDTAAADETVECDGSGNTTALNTWLSNNGGATATDACSDVTWSYSPDPAAISDECGETGSVTVTFTASDACSNTSTTTATFTIEDTTDPSIDTAAADETVECDGSGNTTALNTWLSNNGGATATDACSDVTWSYSPDPATISDECGETGSVTVTFTASDACSNTSTTTATFTIEDTTDPSIDTAAADETVECDGSGNTTALNTWLSNNGGATATDACSDVTWSYSPDPATISDECGETGSVTVTFTASDACSNTSTTTATFTIEDTTDPSIDTAAADETVECDGSGNTTALNTWLSNNGGATATDACSAVTWSYSPDPAAISDECGETGSVTVTFTASDACSNTSTTTATFTIEDTTDPSIDTAAADETVECDGSGNTTALNTWLSNNGGATATDACSAVTWSYSPDPATISDECGETGSVTVTFTASDACSNTSTTTATFTIQDTTDPSIDTAAADETVECDGSGNTAALNTWLSNNGGATATDACSDVTWSYSPDPATISDECGETGSVTVTFTASDACSNTSTTTATFTIQDTTDPTASADAEVDVACDEYDAETEYGNFTASDACGEVTVEIEDLQQSGACPGTVSRTYTITDECGRSTTVSQTITLTDVEGPTFDIACPDDAVIFGVDASCEADTSAATLGMATYSNVMDNCDTDVDMAVSYDDEVVSTCQGEYTVTRTFTITGTDHCDNVTSKTCTQTITVTDETDPVITGGADETVQCDGSGNTAALNAWLDSHAGATATDNCEEPTWSNDFTGLSNDCGATGSATVTFTATDCVGNTSSTTHTFTIEDTTAPALSITGPANQDLEQNESCDLDTSVAALGNVTATATDNCTADADIDIEIASEDGEITYSCTSSDECNGSDAALEGSYTFIRTFTVTATDDCGNSTMETYEQTITVTDNIAPQLTNTCGLANNDEVPVCCTDNAGTVTIPAACTLEATDNCDSEVAICYEEQYVGEYAPTGDVMSYCLSTTPAAFADGEACNGLDPHSFSLFNFDGQPRVDFTSFGAGTVAQMNDGTWVLTQELTNEAETGTLSLSVTYGAASSWDDFYVPGQTNYKRDCGVLIDDHLNWDYRIMESGSIVGSGDYAGLNLSLSHAPANEYFAMQVGLGANNQNNNYGYSGWILASGTWNSEAVFFSGDLFGDLDCCLPWSIERDYIALDDCDNSTSFAYTIDVNSDECEDDTDPLLNGDQDDDHTPVILGGAGDLTNGKSPIRVTNLQPNPTQDLSLLGFTVSENMRLRVDMYTMDGILVTELYDGIASPNVNHTLDIEASDLQSGMYQIRLSSSQYLVVKKLLVTE